MDNGSSEKDEVIAFNHEWHQQERGSGHISAAEGAAGPLRPVISGNLNISPREVRTKAGLDAALEIQAASERLRGQTVTPVTAFRSGDGAPGNQSGKFSPSSMPARSSLRKSLSRSGSATDVGGPDSPGDSGKNLNAPTAPLGPRAPSAARSARRRSFLDIFKGEEEGAAQPAPSPSARMSSDGPPAASRSARRKSFLDFFKHEDGEGGDAAGAVDSRAPSEWGEAGPALSVTQKSKSRRSSFIDFFKGGADGADGQVSRAASRRGSMGNVSDVMGSGKSRRASMVDIFNTAGKRGLSFLQKMVNKDAPDYVSDEELEEPEEDDKPLVFTSLDDFRPLTYRYHKGRFVESYFACSIKTGEHFILKIYYKELMEMSELRKLRRAFELLSGLEHEHLIKVKGTWETDEALYCVEEYAIKGDLQANLMGHPERYTEAFVAVQVVKPLLDVLVYLHEKKIIHRSIFPEHLLFGRGDKLQLSHFVSAVDSSLDVVDGRINFLDYMAPEMLSVKTSEDGHRVLAKGGDAPGAASSAGPRQGRRGPKKRSSFWKSAQDQLLGGNKENSGLAPEASFLGPEGSENFGAQDSGGLGPEKSLNDVAMIVPNNAWEWQDTYDEKVDVWQVGCLVHELLCGSLPFETDNKLLAAALILWADIVAWPDIISTEAVAFMQAALTKDPRQRPSAAQLLEHPWITRHVAGETIKSVKQVREEEEAAKQQAGLLGGFSHARQGMMASLAEGPFGWLFGGGCKSAAPAGPQPSKLEQALALKAPPAAAQAGEGAGAGAVDPDNPFARHHQLRQQHHAPVPPAEVDGGAGVKRADWRMLL